MAAEVLAQGGAQRHGVRPDAGGRAQVPARRPRRAQPHAQRTARRVPRRATARRRRICAMRSRRFRPTSCAPGAKALGQETFVGSSGRVFPRSLKASPLLRAWLRRLDAAGVVFKPRHRWTGWDDDGALTFETPAGVVTERADATVLALGGASWPRLGSDGSWAEIMTRAGIAVAPLRPANCGVLVELVGRSSAIASKASRSSASRCRLAGADRARRGGGHAHRPRRRRHLCAVGADPRRDRCRGRGDPAHRPASRSHGRRR